MILNKKLLILLAALGISTAGFSQWFPAELIMDNGPSEKMIDLVFLSDGYTASEIDKFKIDVQNITSVMFSQTPFKEYKNYFNVAIIKVPSNESGASHPKTAPDCGNVPYVASVDNYFGSTFDFGNIHRMLVSSKASKVASVLAASYPQYDQVFFLVNSPLYGGSSGAYATATNDASSPEVVLHELGHSFAYLADEYWAGLSGASERPNLTQESNPALVKWNNWIGTNLIGVYPHENPTWYRPHPNCRMRNVDKPFCSVCIENFVERIQNLTNPIQSFSPATGPVTLAPTIPFSLLLILPDPNTIQTTWKLNGAVIATNVNTVSISRELFVQKQNEIEVQVLDNTGLSRIGNKATAHMRVLTWTVAIPDDTYPVITDPIIPDPVIIDPVVTGLEVIASEAHYKIEVYPNPVQDKLHVSYDLSQAASVRLAFTDMLGRTLTTVVDERQEIGTHSYDFNPDNLNITSDDLYIMRLEIDGAVVTKKLVKD